MKKPNDVEALFIAIDEDPDKYQEITRDQDAVLAIERWPLIAAINQISPIHDGVAVESVVTDETGMGSKKNHGQTTLEIASDNKVKTIVTTSELLIEEKFVGVEQSVGLNISDITIENSLRGLPPQSNVLTIDTSHIASASTEDIGSIFKRLQSQ